MKKFFIYLAIASCTAWLLSSCDKLDEPYATVKKVDDDTATQVRRVLLEDYTGHKCVNCPEAALAARALEEAHGGKLIVMAVHAGFFAEPSTTGDFTANYTSQTGNDWNTYFGITSNPNGMVNRKSYSGARILGMDLWANAIETELALPQEAEMVISNSYNETTRALQTSVNTKFLAGLEGSYNLIVCIVEDSLISPQKNSNANIGYPVPVIYDWVFMDVLRGSINGTWGEELTATVDITKTYVKNYTFTLNEAWVPKNCPVLAFISKADSREVVQVEKEPVISSQ